MELPAADEQSEDVNVKITESLMACTSLKGAVHTTMQSQLSADGVSSSKKRFLKTETAGDSSVYRSFRS